MNTLEDLLQERLEQLEAGQPLAVCQAGLPAEEAELLQLTAMLQELAYPVPDGATAVAQRASLQRLAQSHKAPPAQTGWRTILTDWWRAQTTARRSALATLAAVALILLAAGLGGLFAPDEAAAPVAMTGSEPAAPVTAPDSVAIPNPVENPEPAVEPAPVAESGNTVFIPIVSIPLDLGPQKAALEPVQGLVEVQTEGGAWTAVSRTTTVAAGQRVRTGALSQAALTFFDGSRAELGPNTELSLDTLDAQPPDKGFRTVVMTQWLGESRHDVQFRNDSGSRYEVKTPNGSGVARGTSFQVRVTADLYAQYTVTKGRVDVTGLNVTVRVTAGQTSAIPADSPPSRPAFRITGEGEVTQIGPEWIVGGQTFQTGDHTIIVGNPQVGDWVRVEGHLLADGGRMADLISLRHRSPANRFTITGPVTALDAAGWTVAGQTITVNEATDVEDGIVVGDTVQVDGLIQDDGAFLAERIRLIAADDGLPFEFTGVVEALDGNAWTISGVAITSDADTEIDPAIVVGDVVKVEGRILADGVWLAREIKLADDDENAFEITGVVESIAPWRVAGIDFTTGDWTEIDPDVVVGDRVKVEGIILADGTWAADEIKRLDERAGLTFVFYGAVDSLAPWVVSGVPLPVTDETAVDPGIAVGDLVRVTVTLLPDGTWLVAQIERVYGDGIDQGCFSVTAVVVSVNGGQIILEDDWPTLTLGDVEIEGDITANSVIVINFCIGEDGDITIVSILVLFTPTTPTLPPGNNVTICHKPGRNQQTLTIPQSALQGHRDHGDTVGACSGGGGDDDHHHGGHGDDHHDDD